MYVKKVKTGTDVTLMFHILNLNVKKKIHLCLHVKYSKDFTKSNTAVKNMAITCLTNNSTFPATAWEMKIIILNIWLPMYIEVPNMITVVNSLIDFEFSVR